MDIEQENYTKAIWCGTIDFFQQVNLEIW